VARVLEIRRVDNVEQLGQTGIFVAAQRRVDDMVGENARFVVVTNAPHRPFGQTLRLGDVEVNAVNGQIWHSGSSQKDRMGHEMW
jgi:hypothetical protein